MTPSDVPKETQEKRPGPLRILVIALVLVAGAAGGILGSGEVLDRLAPETADARGGGGRPEQAALVGVAPVDRETMRETVEAVGTIRATQAIDVVPMSAGRIVEIGFDAGEEVEEGQLLVQLDDRVEQARLKEMQATLVEAEQAFSRAQKLQEQNYAPEARFEEARANLLRAEAAVDQAENALEDQAVRAPFAGTTGLVEVEKGQRIDTGTTITTLDDLSEVEVTFSVPEVFFPRIDRGQSVLLHSRAFGGRTFEGEVSEIDARISPRSRAFRVRATIPNEDRALRTGMFMSIELVLEEREAITVPEEAVISEGDASYVFTVADNRAERREVRTGVWRDGQVEVVEGLEDDATIVTSGLQSLEDGASVSLKEAVDEGGRTGDRRG